MARSSFDSSFTSSSPGSAVAAGDDQIPNGMLAQK
jgi:hypothetical protein